MTISPGFFLCAGTLKCFKEEFGKSKKQKSFDCGAVSLDCLTTYSNQDFL